MRLFTFLFCGLLLLNCNKQKPTDQNQETKAEEWIQLFNGKDLTGWKSKISGHELGENFNNNFKVENGILKADYSEYDTFRSNFGHLFYEKPFSHYRLKIEYRILGDQLIGGPSWARQNSGVMLHSQSPESMELNQNFPISIEMQFLSAIDSLDRRDGNLASPGTHVNYNDSLWTNHMLYASDPAPANGEWVSVEAVVLGDSIIHHIVEGDTVLTYTQPQIGGWEQEDEIGWVEDKTWVTENKGMPLKEGYIALQAESHPVEFRKVELMDLSEEYQ